MKFDSFEDRIIKEREESQAILTVSHADRNIKILPVETSTYRTADFRQNPDALLYSTGISACVVLLIKNHNATTGKYDNIVTMAHFFPNNAYDENIATINITAALNEFVEAGGVIGEKTSIQLLGGGLLPGQNYNDTPKAIIQDALTVMKLDKQCKFSVHRTSLNSRMGEAVYIFASKNGTQVTKRLPGEGHLDATLLTPPDPEFPLDMLRKVESQLPAHYINFAHSWSERIGNLSQRHDGMELKKLTHFLQLKALSERNK